MIIEINAKEVLGDYIIVYYTLTDDLDTIFRYHARLSVMDDASLQNYLSTNIENIYAELLRMKYPGCDLAFTLNRSRLVQIQEWIDNGHKTLMGKVVEEVPFSHTHRGSDVPPELVDRSKIVGDTRLLLQTAQTVEELRQAVSEILLGKDYV